MITQKLFQQIKDPKHPLYCLCHLLKYPIIMVLRPIYPYQLPLSKTPITNNICFISGLLLPRCMKCRGGLAMRILSVSLSVRPSVCDKTEEKSVQIFTPYETSKTSFSLVFWEEWLVGRPLLSEILDQPAPFWAKSPILNRGSASAVTPSETLIGSPLPVHAFQWA